VGFQLRLAGQDYAGLRRSVAAFMLCAAAMLAGLLPSSPARAQSYTWVGATTDYGTATNWSNPGTAPPIFPTQRAIFGGTGSTAVTIGAGPMLPDSWTFTSNAQAYVISGNPVAFSLSGPTGGVINNGNLGQRIEISANITDGIGGAIGVQQLGNSTLVLSGANGYSGGTLISAGTVQVTNANSLGSGTVTLNGGSLQMQSPTVVSVAFSNNFAVNAPGGTVDANGAQVNLQGVIADGAGAGVLRLIDSTGSTTANVQLSGVNTYSGGTLVSGTTVVVSNNSSVGTGTVTIGDNGLFQADGLSNLTFTNNFKTTGTAPGAAIDSNGTTLTIAGNISGAGKLTVLDSFGGGAVVLLGSNTYTGGTFICSCGTLQIGDATHTASIVGGITNEGQLGFVNANTSGITSITNSGVTIFFGTTSASSMTITNDNGGTIFLAKTNAGTATITNIDGGGVEFFNQASAASATITNNNGSFTSFGQPGFTDTPTAGNAVIINNSGGETDFNAFSTAGNATITTNSGGATFFSDNSTGGAAQFITNGTGFVDFSESLGPNGDGRITAGSIAGSGSYYIGGGNTLVVGGNNLSTTMSGVIADNNPCGCTTGSGSLEKVGAGTLILSGTNSYTGTTAVNGGVLQVDGSIESSSQTTVNANGTLAGAGTVGNTTIASGGIFAPGNTTPGSFITVAGNLAFQSGALYLVQFSSTTSSFANVTGTAALNGQVGTSFAPGSTVMKQYMILSAAGGVSGGFAGVTAPGGLVGIVSYDPTHAYLNFTLNFAAKYALTVNQQNVATTLGNFFNANGSIPFSFASLTPAGLTQASGELATGSQQATFDAMSQFLGLLTDPFLAGRSGAGGGAGATPFAEEGDASAYAASKSGAARDAFARIPTKADVARNDLFDPRWNVWGAAYGGGSNTSGNAALGSNSATARAFGFVAGADYQLSPATLAGFALAGGGTNFGVSSFGSGRSDLFQAGAFVRHTVGAAYVTAAAAYGWQDVTTDRTVTIAGIDQLHAEFNANAYSGRLEGGTRFATPWMGVTPYAAGQFTTYSLPAYAEQALSGANTFALSYAAKDVTASRSELGVRTDRSFAVSNGILTLRGRFAWAHDFDTDRDVTALFQTLPGASFVVNGAAQAHDSALTTASAEMKWRNGISLAGTFEGQFSDVTNSYAGKGVVRYSW
jgi:autotransporter-associated beta strand protein